MHVILLAPHFPANQLRFVQGLKNVGARVTGIIDAPRDRVPSQALSLLDDAEFITNVTSVEQVEGAVRRIQRRGPWVHRLEATVEAHVRTAALVRERTGIPGTPAQTAELCRDKYTMKAFLLERGFPCARQTPVGTAEEARAAAQDLGLPCILKPRDGAGAAGTFKIRSEADLERAIAESGLARGGAALTMEEFLSGHEGFYDTLTVKGEVVMDFVSHYFPNVLPAMRDRSVSPMVVVTNRIEAESYNELRHFGSTVVKALGVETSATHMEWFFGPQGLKFSEIGARPPGVGLWDIYADTNGFDLYTEWARAICWGTVAQRPSRRFSGGLLAIRPDRDGRVVGYRGVEAVQAKYGAYIVKAHLPPEGSPTQPIEAGYRANAWLQVRHPDYDGCRAMMTDIGNTLKMFAR